MRSEPEVKAALQFLIDAGADVTGRPDLLVLSARISADVVKWILGEDNSFGQGLTNYLASQQPRRSAIIH